MIFVHLLMMISINKLFYSS